MKFIGSILCLIVPFSAFTAFYSGAGDWKSNSGISGNYSVQANIEPVDDNTISISQTLMFDNQVLNFSVLLQKIDDNFYDVLNAQGDDVGDGYCWILGEEAGMICHTISHEDGYVVESTIRKTDNAIYRIGSKTNLENQEKLIWNDALFLGNNG